MTIENKDLKKGSSITWSAHTFQIPVMGTAFTIDTPLRVGRYGISSVVSIADHVLMEQMRKHHCEKEGEVYEEIPANDPDVRARRTTAYLNLLDRLLKRQVKALQSSAFEEGSEITRYYNLLPEGPLKREYQAMLELPEGPEKTASQEALRRKAVPGAIDVNLMTKVDQDVYQGATKLPPELRHATAAFRGYAQSDLCSSIVFSAGMNPRLYTYTSQFEDFFPDEDGFIKKKIVLKVSDYRSALIQGKFLAKKGLWVSEYRIESGLNCGGHAFATTGFLMGPILNEFKQKKNELIEFLHGLYSKALAAVGRFAVKTPPDVRITVQGGIETHEENDFLMKHYELDGTGWGTPFLLVPEAVTIDDEHLGKLARAGNEDVYLSGNSPMGVPFWSLRDSGSEEARRKRIIEGRPGAPCPKGFLRFNTEFTEAPLCTASRAYQELKLKHLDDEGLDDKQKDCVRGEILEKGCICHDLAGCATLKYGIDPEATPSVCCGPSIVNFSKIATLEEMAEHIYGRLSLLTNTNRPHMFIRELMLYVDHIQKELEKYSLKLSLRTPEYFKEFRENLLEGIGYYTALADHFLEDQRESFLRDLQALAEKIEALPHGAVHLS